MKDTDWELLYELYKTPNISKVANILFTSQPSLTKRLQHIEAEFDVLIVERTPKGLEFTPEGKYLAAQAEAYLQFIRQTKSHLEEMRESSEGLITIGASYTYSKYTLTDQLIRYREKHPNVTVSVQNAPSNILFRNVLDGSVDVAFVKGDFDGAVNKIHVGTNLAYAMTKEPISDLWELKNMKRLWYSTNAESLVILDRWWENWFHEKAPLGQVLGYLDNVWQMVQKGLGYTLCFLPDAYSNPYSLCITPLVFHDGGPVYRNTWFLYPSEKRLTEITEEFVSFVRQDIMANDKDKINSKGIL